MSQWTHVCGCFRFDAVREIGMPFATLDSIKELMGKTCSFEDSSDKWDACDVPCGSEGSIQFIFWENPSISSLAAFTVAIFGDLRDFGNEDVPKIIEWFERIMTTEGVMVRNAIIEIDAEGNEEPIILRYKSK